MGLRIYDIVGYVVTMFITYLFVSLGVKHLGLADVGNFFIVFISTFIGLLVGFAKEWVIGFVIIEKYESNLQLCWYNAALAMLIALIMVV